MTDERLWTKDKAAEVRGTVSLTADREVRGLHIYEPDEGWAMVHLNGKTLRVGREGIHMRSFISADIKGLGNITAVHSDLNIYIEKSSSHVLGISSVITDSTEGKVNLVVSGHHGNGYGIVQIYGSQSNTFTGDLYVKNGNFVSLIKSKGATAISGNAYVEDGSILGIYLSNQIADSSTVYLKGKTSASRLTFSNQQAENISEKFNKLVIDGAGIVEFEGQGRNNFLHGQRHLYLDDLEIEKDSRLLVRQWKEGRDHILVRRDSAHLEESLERIKFEGYDPNAIHLVDYDKDYWEINALPEPAAYGAGLGFIGFGLVLYRRRRKTSPAVGGEDCSGAHQLVASA